MSHVATVTIDNTKVSADLTDYVVYIDLSDLPAAFWDVVANGGGDIRVFKDDDTTELAREVVSCDTATDTGELHIKFSGTLSSSADTDIHIYADGTSSEPAVTATYGRNNVWSDYVSVYHMNESSGNLTDSTGNGNTATASNPATYGATGQLGDGLDFDGSADYYSINHMDVFSGSATLWSISMWINTTQTSSGRILTHDETGAATGEGITLAYENEDIWFRGYGTTASYVTDFNDGNNHYIKWVKSGSTIGDIIFYDNTGSGTGSGSQTLDYVGNSGGEIGRRYNASSDQYDGILDEYRMSTTDLSGNWHTTEYNNQNSPSTFYSAAAAGGGAPATTKNLLMLGVG